MDAAPIEALLRGGDMELVGLLPRSSNHAFVARVTSRDRGVLAVYKPRTGETPLWDFPEGTLWAREVAAYEVSKALGWGLVPPTIAREGEHGLGSVQLLIDVEPGEHYFTLMEAHADTFRRLALYDILVNNADRKSGHCLLEKHTNKIWVVDHGVCFHAEHKLRTVIWDFVGEPIPVDLLDDLARADALPLLEGLLDDGERAALAARATALRGEGVFPAPVEGVRPYPWPPI